MATAYDFDIIIIGSGAGGATMAYACAKAGKSVLLLERGRKHAMPGVVHDERAMLIDKLPYDDRSIDVNGAARRVYMGGVFGGGTTVYGAALLRPSSDDFHPGRHFGSRIPRAIWDWPVTYADLAPYYDQAEELYAVSARSSDDFGPLEAPRRAFDNQFLSLAPINEHLMASNRAVGLTPFQLPLAIDAARCLRCDACAGFVCPNGSRRSAAQLVEEAVMRGDPLNVITNVEVEKLETAGGNTIRSVQVVDRALATRTIFRARRYVLAAGAIGSPVILQRSGIDAPLLGRNYMMHLSPIVIGFFPSGTGANDTFVKQVGFADHYHGTKRAPNKLGLIQSLPAPGPLMFAKCTSRWLPPSLLRFVRKRMLPLAGIVEDLPNPENQVRINGNSQIQLHHRFDPYDLRRGRQLSRLMRRILARAGAWFCVSKTFPSEEHVAHQCGTLRFGTRPEHAVLDSDCRFFSISNLFAVDGSFFPTSLGVGPSLTIIANALRVADTLVRET